MAAFEDLLSELPIKRSAREGLRQRLASAERHYHGTGHVGLLWQRHLEYGAGLPVAEAPWHRLIACAIAFHDAVHDPLRGDNEPASAALWRASEPALSPEDVAWVAGTILATADHLAAVAGTLSAAAWSARCWVLDLDLTPLGEPPEVFAANTRQIRREFGHLTDAAWEARNTGFLRRMADAPAIYRSTRLGSVFDRQARRNLRQALAHVSPPGDPG